MTDLNHVVLIGRLTRDLGTDERSFGYVANGQARANVSIAVNRSRKSGDQWIDEANYFDITIWGKQAEALKPYLTKGKLIAVDGYLKQDRWEKDGVKQSRVSIVANNVQLLSSRNEGSSNNTAAPRFQQINEPQNNGFYNEGFPSDSYGDTASDFPENIPF